MAAATTLLVLVLALLLKQTQDLRADAVTVQRMWQRENFLYHGVKKLLQDIRWIRSPQEAPLLSVSQLCLFWAAAAVMVLEICWLAWQMKSTLCTCHEQDSSGSEEEEDEEKEEKLREQRPRVRLFSVPTLLPVQGLSDMCRDVKKMTLAVLRVCRALSKNTFMPELHPAAGRNGVHESWSIFEDRIVYQLLVLLQPPSGHSFRLEQFCGTQLPERSSNVRVVLECTCPRPTGDAPCFVHPAENQEAAQPSALLQTLCTGSYLDVEETACWAQNSVQTAWEPLPQRQHWQLTVLPSSRSCRLLLSGPSELQLCAVLVFAVEQGSPGTFLILQ
ncbi:PREDICTED: inositol 1,4,5-trisphosphate receptor-interacting protein-like 1 [Ficedula albicollis]|uniref:inositol 1,4,5-trisphosphate receptor-interacting protein-like 1 n=1 Tax=Ficedula albicollis TaxID=59894 RepID=UPI000359A9E0|nr:PREDICTED: inositol 1,4,5-trisphosphate receptor-interacting protein-like 1 [Ficedula albicollis]